MKYHVCTLDGESIRRSGEGCCYCLVDELIDTASGKRYYLPAWADTESYIDRIEELTGDEETAKKLSELYAEFGSWELRDGEWDVENSDDYAEWDRVSTDEAQKRFREAALNAGLNVENFEF